MPEWPTAPQTRDEAIVAALDEMEPGDVFWRHQDWCGTRLDEECDCVVALVPFPTVTQ
jgi:hypothetical protein